MEESNRIKVLKVLRNPEGYNAHVSLEGDGYVGITYEELESGKGSIDARVIVEVDIKGATNKGRRFSGRLNLLSNSGQEGFVRNLKSSFGKDYPWTVMLSEATEEVIRYHRSSLAEEVKTAFGVDAGGSTEYLLDPFIEASAVNIIFGMGGTGKTFLSLRMAMALACGQGFLGDRNKEPMPVLFLDYENNLETFVRRMRNIAKYFPAFTQEHEKNMHYLKPKGAPVHEVKETLRRAIRDKGVKLLVIDSAALACGGQPEDAISAIRMFNALSSLDVTVLIIAHETKSENHQYVFGSIFFHNSARNIWNVQVDREQDDKVIHVGLAHRKSNNDRLQSPKSVRIFFAEDGVDINPESNSRWDTEMSAGKRIMKYLADQKIPVDIKEIEAYLDDLSRKTIVNNLTELYKKGRVYNPSKGMWGASTGENKSSTAPMEWTPPS